MADLNEIWVIIKDQLGAVSNSLATYLKPDSNGGLSAMILSTHFQCPINAQTILQKMDECKLVENPALISHLEILLQAFIDSPLFIENQKEKDVIDENLLRRKLIDKKDLNLYILSWLVVIGFYSLVGVLMWKPIPKGSNEVLFILFGSLSSGFGTVLGYFFGGSKGSDEKTKLMSLGKK